jgi:hypothetical protein
MRTTVVATLPRPGFCHGRDVTTGADIGEDRTFCRALGAAGIPIVIDHDLSREITHLGLYAYGYTDAADVPLAVQRATLDAAGR